MPQRNSSRRMVTRLVLFSLAGWALWALGRNHTRAEEPEAATPDPWDLHVELDEVTTSPRPSPQRFSKRRLATSLAFATLFFAGAAFSAGAGDVLVQAVEGTSEQQTTSTSTSTEELAAAAATVAAAAEELTPATTEEAPAADPAPAPEAEQAAAEQPTPAEEAPASEPAPAPAAEQPAAQPAAEQPAPSQEAPASQPAASPAPQEQPAAQPATKQPAAEEQSASKQSARDRAAAREPEVEDEAAFATVWLHRTLPDPTPSAKRLSRAFAQRLRTTAATAGVDWALMLGVLRADGRNGKAPASRERLERLASRLAASRASADAWRAVLALRGRTGFADRAVALSRYNRAVGLRALVRGLEASKPALVNRVLRDPRIDLYAGGYGDVASGRVDVRLLVLMRYLAESHGQVTVSSLRTGHRFYARPGVPSAHVYGLAVDVSALGGAPISGNQEPNGLTERAVRNILLLPAELQPQQVISLLGLGGPSFPMGDHHDHIHVGY